MQVEDEDLAPAGEATVVSYRNSSPSRASSIASQAEMRRVKATAGFRAFKGYDYRIECEAQSPNSRDPIKLHFSKKRLRRIMAVSLTKRHHTRKSPTKSTK